MIRAALVFVVALVLCAAFGTASAGCEVSECECPDGAPLPWALSPQRITFSSFDSDASVRPDLTKSGRMEINGAKVIFRYDQSGVTHEVVYKIHPNP
jgi:hypothetical protein